MEGLNPKPKKSIGLILPGQYIYPFTLPVKKVILVTPIKDVGKKTIPMHKSKAIMILRAHYEYAEYLSKDHNVVITPHRENILEQVKGVGKRHKDTTIHMYVPQLPLAELQMPVALGCVFHEDPTFLLPVQRLRDHAAKYPAGRHYMFADFVKDTAAELGWPIISDVSRPANVREIEVMPFDPPSKMMKIPGMARLPRCKFGRLAYYPATSEEAEAWLSDFIKYRLLDVPVFNGISLTKSIWVCNDALDAAMNIGIISAKFIADKILASKAPTAAKSCVLMSLLRREYRRFVGATYGVTALTASPSYSLPMNVRWYVGDLGVNPIDFLIKKADQFGYLHNTDLRIFLSFAAACRVQPAHMVEWLDRNLIYCVRVFPGNPSFMSLALTYEMINWEPWSAAHVLECSNFMRTNGPDGSDWTVLWNDLIGKSQSPPTKRYLKTITETDTKLNSYVVKKKV